MNLEAFGARRAKPFIDQWRHPKLFFIKKGSELKIFVLDKRDVIKHFHLALSTCYHFTLTTNQPSRNRNNLNTGENVGVVGKSIFDKWMIQNIVIIV